MTDRPLLDTMAEALPLDDGYRVVWAVYPDGSRLPWIMAPLCDHCDDHCATHGSLENAPHEKTGPMPGRLRRQLFGDPRCGALRSNGEKCRAPVKYQGDRCHVHPEEVEA